MKSLCVFCGSSTGASPQFLKATHEVAKILAMDNITLVYGGGNVGLMGILADAVLSRKGKVIGVIPRSLLGKEVAHSGLTKLHTVDSMHERKQLMYDLSDGFIALPGGLGTLDELCEILTWAQLGLHQKPCGLLNVAGYFDLLLRFFDEATKQKFVTPQHRKLIVTESSPQALIKKLKKYRPPALKKWIDKEEV